MSCGGAGGVWLWVGAILALGAVFCLLLAGSVWLGLWRQDRLITRELAREEEDGDGNVP
jgi:hypothetical protein